MGTRDGGSWRVLATHKLKTLKQPLCAITVARVIGQVPKKVEGKAARDPPGPYPTLKRENRLLLLLTQLTLRRRPAC